MEAEDIVRALAAREEPTIRSDFYGDIESCSVCDGELTPTGERYGDGSAKFTFAHAADCPWVLANEWVAEHEATKTRGRSTPGVTWEFTD